MNLIALSALSPTDLKAFALIYGLAIFVVHVVMALATNGDAKRISTNGGGCFLFGPLVWGWIVFIFGLAGLALYWVVHHSTLRAARPPIARKPE